jgi:hypothetical protein
VLAEQEILALFVISAVMESNTIVRNVPPQASEEEPPAARRELSGLLNTLSRAQWSALRRDLGISSVSREECVNSFLDQEVHTAQQKAASWMTDSESSSSARVEPPAHASVMLTSSFENSLEGLLSANEQVRDIVFNLLPQRDATSIRACSSSCKEAVAAFDWPFHEMNVKHLGRWRASRGQHEST